MVIPAEATIQATFGPFVTGIMLQMMLMGVIVIQTYDYYRVFVNDPLRYKLLVLVLGAISSLQCTMDYCQLYRCTVTFYGNFDKFDDTDWTLWWEIAVTAILGSISQAFFLDRCWNATKSRIVVIIGTMGILCSLGSGIASTIEFQRIKRLSLVPNIPGPILTWLISSAVIDLGVAVVLVWNLANRKTRFKKTETVVSRIVRLTFTTSSLTATIAVINVILYLGLPGKAYHLLPQLSMGKLYVISTMVTLASRTELREILGANDHTSYMDSHSGQKGELATMTRGQSQSQTGSRNIKVIQSNNSHAIQVHTHTITYTHEGDSGLVDDTKRGEDFTDLEEQASDIELENMRGRKHGGEGFPPSLQTNNSTTTSIAEPVHAKDPTFTRLGETHH
ncbi:hypothetical protein FRB96_005765 [Tulasnella sp. 330]|nr:hypothetical protein FRB96_005765 [Tulasnella sp. 330]